MYKTLFLIVFFLSQINIASSEIYKWVDENGKTVYGDKPVLKNDAEIINIRKEPEHDLQYEKQYKKQQKLLDVMKEERNERIALQKEELEKKEKQKEKCAELIKELQETKEARLLYEKTDDPDNPRIYTDEERKAEEEKYSKYIKENC